MKKQKDAKRKKDLIKNYDDRASVDLEGEDLYKSSPIVTNYYFQYKHNN